MKQGQQSLLHFPLCGHSDEKISSVYLGTAGIPDQATFVEMESVLCNSGLDLIF